MKFHSLPVVVILPVLLLSACRASTTPTQEAALDNIYTSAASTPSAEETIATPTPTEIESYP